MDEARATRDEFDAVIELPPPPPPKRRRPHLTWRDLRMFVLGVCAIVGLMVALLYGLALLMFLPHQLAHTKQVSDYPRLLTRFRTIYRSHMDLFPPSIPAGAIETELDANPESMLQGKPHIRLGMRLSPADAAAERARLQILKPDWIESQNTAGASPVAGIGDAERGIHIEWDTGRVSARSWHNPQTGWFYYEVSGG